MDIPRAEYPRPQCERKDWLCLNGVWQFEIDAGDSGLERGLLERPLEGRIVVPFCPESKLSGIEHVDFMNAVWYRREVAIPNEWAGRKVLLHFQAVDYDATVWVNGVEVGRHRGGFGPFTCDLGGVASPGDIAVLVVRARDLKSMVKPAGKQCPSYHNAGCHYTRTTGIWQTVWMEPVSGRAWLLRPRITPDVAGRRFRIELPLRGRRAGLVVRAQLFDGDEQLHHVKVPADADFSPVAELIVPEGRVRLWGPGDPHLYRIRLELMDRDGVCDAVESYGALRGIVLDGAKVLLNGRPVFQRLVLDQGYYPDGILTAPIDAALRGDIELSMAAGFNGARLHQKVFEERFLYHADRLGYLVWGEFADWGLDQVDPKASYITQWLEVLERDYSHPCIIGWCGLNETIQTIGDPVAGVDDLTRGLFLAAKAMDTSRPVLDTSGYSHRVRESDVNDCHDYEQDVEKFRRNHAGLADGKPFVNGEHWSIPHAGQPFFVSEFGGIWWNPEPAAGEPSWGYGERPKTIEEFYARFEGLCNVLLDHPRMFGYCYTQLTDIYQEQNGIYHFDRRPKFDVARLRRIQTRLAAIEKT